MAEIPEETERCRAQQMTVVHTGPAVIASWFFPHEPEEDNLREALRNAIEDHVSAQRTMLARCVTVMDNATQDGYTGFEGLDGGDSSFMTELRAAAAPKSPSLDGESCGSVERRKLPQDWDRRIAPPRNRRPASKFGGATFEHFLHGTMSDQREGFADRRAPKQ